MTHTCMHVHGVACMHVHGVACMHVHGVAGPPQQKDMDTRCVQMCLVSYPCEHDLSGGGT